MCDQKSESEKDQKLLCKIFTVHDQKSDLEQDLDSETNHFCLPKIIHSFLLFLASIFQFFNLLLEAFPLSSFFIL